MKEEANITPYNGVHRQTFVRSIAINCELRLGHSSPQMSQSFYISEWINAVRAIHNGLALRPKFTLFGMTTSFAVLLK